MLGLIVQQSIEAHFLQQDADELQVVAETVRATLANRDPLAPATTLQPALEHAVSGHHAVFFLVADADNNIIYATPGADLTDIVLSGDRVTQISPDTIYSWENDNTTYRGAALRLDAANGSTANGSNQAATLVVATSIDFHMEFMDSFYRNLWGVVIGISVFSILAAWLAVHQGHSPLREVSTQIRDISSEKLHLRVDTTQVPIELLDLVAAFNDMLQRMEDVFNRLSNFSADIAHELRTPLTNIITQTQVSLNQPRTVNEYQEILYSNLEEYERMAAMINDMLMLAKTEGGLIEPNIQELDICAEVQELFDFFGAWSEENQVTLDMVGKCPIVQCDRAMIKRALSNLLSNAIRHSTRGSTVKVIFNTEPDYTRIIIENTGTTIPPDQLAKIFDRFYRGDPSRQRRGDGAGLGLAIVKSIAEVHGWSVTANSKDGVTQFTLQLPART